MSEYELADAFRSYAELVMTFMMAFISVTSAFLLVVHTSAKVLSPLLAKLIVGLYSVSSVYLLLGAQRTSIVITDIRSQMKGTLEWHTAAYEPQIILPVFNGLLILFMTALFVGSLWYFRKERQRSKDM